MIAIYTRQSLEKKDSISMETQAEFCRREAGEGEIKLYADRGFSGKNTDRPAFLALMNDLDRLPITKVIVYRLDRISRSLLDFADFIAKLEEKHISFVSATEKFDTASPMGRAMLYIIAVFAQLERETIAQRVRDNYYARLSSGAIGGGPAPFGFRLCRIQKDGRAITVYAPQKEELALVEQLFFRYALPQTSLADLRHFLQEELGAKAPPFSNARLSSLLRSPVYVKADSAIYAYYAKQGVQLLQPPDAFDGLHGCLLAGKQTSSPALSIAHQEGLIPSALFLACQQKLEQNRTIRRSGRGQYSFLTGLIRCDHCGHSVSVRHSHCAQGNVAYFVCSGRYLHHCCPVRQTHRVSEVEAVVEDALQKRIDTIPLPPPQALWERETEKGQLEEKINGLLSALESAPPAVAAAIHPRLDALLKQKSALETKETILLPPPKFALLSLEEKHMVAACLLQQVTLAPQTITLHWKDIKKAP